jgi:adenylate cyclase
MDEPPLANLTTLMDRLQSRIGDTAGRLVVAWLIIGVAVGGASSLGWLEKFELLFYDTAIALSGESVEDAPVVLVGATDADLQKYGWPLPDERLALAVEKIATAGALAVGVDLYRDRPVGGDEEVLAALLRRYGNVVFVSKLSSGNLAAIEAPRAIRGSTQVGFADIPVDDDGVTRRALLFAEDNGKMQTSLGIRLALRALEARGIKPERVGDTSKIRLGATTIRPIGEGEGPYHRADTGGYQLLIDFHENGAGFRRFSVSDVLEGRADLRYVKGRVVIVGTTAQSVKDYFSVPSNRILGDRQVFGIELHGQIVTQLLRLAEGRSGQMLGLPPVVEYAWMLIVAAVALGIGWWGQRLPVLIGASFGGLVLIVLGHALAYRAGWWAALTPPVLAWVIGVGWAIADSMQSQSRQRKQLMSLFSRYFSHDVAEQIWTRREEVLGSGGMPAPQQLVATVFFSDLAGFTSKAEVLAPKELTELLNAYFEAAVAIIHRNGGSIDKFIGDAVMAVFGVPIPRMSKEEIFEDARRAVRSAVEFAAAIEVLNQGFVAAGLPTIAVRIGIHTGPVVAGSIGSTQRMEYTVIGDSVNVAARLEGLDKAGRGDAACRILISETTRHCLDDSFNVQRLGEFKLHGKQEAVEVYHVLGFTGVPDKVPVK